MAARERQRRYLTTGAAAGLVKVETLVPPEARAEILRLAARLRKRARRPVTTPDLAFDVGRILERVRELCAVQPRRYAGQVDVDNVVTTSVNVPFPVAISAQALVDALRSGQIPTGYGGHLERFIGETPLFLLLRFCDRHGIAADTIHSFVTQHRHRLSINRPDLDTHLDALDAHRGRPPQ